MNNERKNVSNEIEKYLKKIIFDRTVKLENPLPSEHFLATKFKVTRQTARNELVKLSNKGFVVSRKGAGYFINPNIAFVKIESISKQYRSFRKDIEEISLCYLQNIINELGIKIDNPKKYFGYKKIYYSESGMAIIQVKSYILKEKFIKIDLNEIRKSLVDYLINCGIEITLQVNKIIILKPSKEDIRIFASDNLIPTVYGALMNNKNEIIEIFERKTVYNKFQYSFVKQK